MNGFVIWNIHAWYSPSYSNGRVLKKSGAEDGLVLYLADQSSDAYQIYNYN